MALMLIYFNTNDPIKDAILLPCNTHTYYNGFHENLTLKLMCKCLISFSHIQNTQAYLNAQIPLWIT